VRSRRDDPMIGVSCGHRVPRVPVARPDGKYGVVYWCEECGAHRMSGSRSTGIEAFDFFLELKDEITARELVVDFDHELQPHQRALVEAFGATVRVRGGEAT